MKLEHKKIIYENCDVKATYKTINGHELIWYDNTCESDYKDEGDYLMWSCNSLNEFIEYCYQIQDMEATNND